MKSADLSTVFLIIFKIYFVSIIVTIFMSQGTNGHESVVNRSPTATPAFLQLHSQKSIRIETVRYLVWIILVHQIIINQPFHLPDFYLSQRRLSPL